MAKRFDDLATSERDDDFYGHLQCMKNETLAALVRGEYDVVEIISRELAARGKTASNVWVGFENARTHHNLRMRDKKTTARIGRGR